MDLAEAERLARAVFNSDGYGEVITALEGERSWGIVFAVDTIDNPLFLVDKRTGHVDVGTSLPIMPEYADEIDSMRVVIERPWNPPGLVFIDD